MASAETAIQQVFDVIAASIHTARPLISSAAAARTSFHAIIDAAADETFENDVNGWYITYADQCLDALDVFSATALRRLIDAPNVYYARLGLASPYFDSYLATKGWRVPYEGAEAFYAALGYRIAAQYVMPPGFQAVDETIASGRELHCFGTWNGITAADTYTEVDGALTNSVGAAVIPVSREATPGGSTPIVTLTRYDASTWDTAALTFDATQYGHGANGVGSAYLGAAAVGVGGAAAAQKDVLCKTAVAQFAEDAYVLLITATTCEVAQIDTIASLTLTMKSNLINALAEDDLVVPLWTNVTRKSGTITNAKHVDFFAQPERLLDLTP